MQKRVDIHQFGGMQRDMSISKQRSEFLWDAHNIRLTARHGDTLLSMTNERGTKKIDDISFTGVVLGYCVLGNYLTVFTTNPDGEKPDYIYRIQKNQDDTFSQTELYNGNLGFDVEHPIECLGVYENEKIQKVYWTDGINQPRFINITSGKKPYEYIDTSFDFIPTLDLKDTIHVSKVADSSGLFAAGVIQYAVTYYNKYGQESNISVVSPLIPTSYTQRAGSPEETIGNAFKVTVKNPDTNFEYMRVYSIFRSSKDTTPICKRVADVKLKYAKTDGYTTTETKTYISSDSVSLTQKELKNSGISFKTSLDGEFVDLKSDAGNPYKVTESNVYIGNNVFPVDSSYHFTKQDSPYLVIKGQVFEGLATKSYMFSWDDCTDIYISYDNIEELSEPTTDQHVITRTYALILANGENNSMVCASDITYYQEQYVTEDSVTITDNGTIGEDVDYNELLFVGGEEITASTITQKDGTMFLGNIKIKRPQITGNYEAAKRAELPAISTYLNNNGEEIPDMDINMVNIIRKDASINKTIRQCWIPKTLDSENYKWSNTLNAHIYDDAQLDESTNIAGFKHGEHYRLGLQFQYKTGKWSQPVYIDDEIMTSKPSLDIWSYDYSKQNVPSFSITLSKLVGQYMLSKEYKRVRSVVCFPTESDQLILCQGLLNPTVHSIAGRLNHTPDVQSSWYFRPVPAGDENTKSGFYEGGIPQHKHGYTLFSGGNDGSANIPTRNDEIQGVHKVFSDRLASGNSELTDLYNLYDDDGDDNHDHEVEINIKIGGGVDLKHYVTDSKDLTNVFVVDWKYLTFHSPEFEFNDSFRNIDTETFDCKIIGKHVVSANQGDIHIITSSAPAAPNATGFYHRLVSSSLSACRINSGLFYKDGIVCYYKNSDTKNFRVGDNDSDSYGFLVYPWHRTGALNNDCIRPEGTGQRTAMLSQKKMINLMYFGDLKHDSLQEKLTGAKITPFNSDQISLIKVNGMNYFGNIDQVLNPPFKYNIGYSEQGFTGELKYFNTDATVQEAENVNTEQMMLRVSSDPVYMKYKSTPHAVLYYDEYKNNSVIDTLRFQSGNQYYPYLYCAEMYREPIEATDFGGKSQNAIMNNLWYPAGPATPISKDGDTVVEFLYGDTYYQRYDCLKTYPFTDEDTNSIIEIGSFMVETRINLDGRYDKNRANISNFMLNPTNYNLINPVYSQMDNFFNYRILDDDYYKLSEYPTMVTWTGYKNNAAEVDNWTNITLASTLEMDGVKGKVNAVRVHSDQLYCFQDDAVGQILFNSRVQISPSDGVPIEISNNYKVDGNRYISTSIGCKNKWSIAEGVDGLYFIDDNTRAMYQLGGQGLKPISNALNMSYWFILQDCATPWLQHYLVQDETESRTYTQKGIRCFYDNANSDLYICTPENTLCYSEKLGQFVSFFDYHQPIDMFNIDSGFYALNYPDDSREDNESHIKDNSSIDMWSMFHGKYNTFFDNIYQTDFTFISNENPLNDKLFTNIELRGDFRYWPDNEPESDFNSENHTVADNRMFDSMKVWNEYQDTDDVSLTFTQDTVTNMKKKFRIWRMDIPRNKNTRDRIRNTWAKVKFTMNTPSIAAAEGRLYDMEIHDVGVVYFA